MMNRLGMCSVVISLVISITGCSTLSSHSGECQADLPTHYTDSPLLLADLTRPDFLKTAQMPTEQKNSL